MRINLSSLEDFMDDGDIQAEITGRASGGNGLAASSSDYSVLLPLLGEKTSREAVRLVSSILAGEKPRLVMLGMVEVASEASLSTGALPAREYRRLLEANDISHRVKVSRNIWQTINATLEGENYDLIVMPWSQENQVNPDYRILLNKLLNEPSVDSLIIKPGSTHQYKRILVCLQSGSDAGLVMDTALSIAGEYGAELMAVHADKRGDYGEEIAHVDVGDHDLIITAAPTTGSNGYRADEIVAPILENTNATVIIAKSSSTLQKRAPFVGILPRKQNGNGMNGRSMVPISEAVDTWFAENTFHADEFSDIEKLVEAKRKQGLTISLGLPTLNEEQTIGVIVETMRTHLCERYPLIDEIVVIDSDSIDSTARIAESLGVEVIRESEILPEWGSRLGKGGALWKSLYALKGDIIAWIDTDIKNIDPRFVYGLVGPLIKYPHIKYVKGFYRRPVKIGDQLIETGGGRVTELTARPLLNLFFPELSGFVQPLSGEYAGRREILERVGFHNGYGVETGLLLNILEQFGLDIMGQVDLVERIHRNQPLESLSKMSFAIMQVIIDKLEERHRVELLNEVSKTMKLIKHESDQFCLDVKSIEETMKPPMFTVPGYRERFMGLELGDMDRAV
ncbi:MAG: glucosyl-3-phosphoglycerate synthase [Candidatus Aquicultor sp.]